MESIRTLFISDIHLGSINSSAGKLLEVFKKYNFEKLVIVGDFIDLTSLKSKFYWHQDHSTVIQKVLRLSRKEVEVIYILGNHDHIIRDLIEDGPVNVGDILICDSFIYTTLADEKIYITHGDCFDGFIRMHPWLYFLGDKAYSLSIFINRWYNRLRKLFGFQYWSLSSYLKTKVKNVVKFVTEYKLMSEEKLKETGCHSIMIGHTHTPEIVSGQYYNVGDFCESCSYMVETLDGDIELRFAK
jgi:UDP-2,3-diacylglucosamine pyrophosphatase LpxH